MTGPQFTATPCDTCHGLECNAPGCKGDCDFFHSGDCGDCVRGWVVLPVKVPTVWYCGTTHGDPTEHVPGSRWCLGGRWFPEPAWLPDDGTGRRTAPIVTLDRGLYFGEDRYLDTGERCSWTLAPVVRDPEMQSGDFLFQTADGTYSGLIDHREVHGLIIKDVSPGDWVAIPDQVTT